MSGIMGSFHWSRWVKNRGPKYYEHNSYDVYDAWTRLSGVLHDGRGVIVDSMLSKDAEGSLVAQVTIRTRDGDNTPAVMVYEQKFIVPGDPKKEVSA